MQRQRQTKQNWTSKQKDLKRLVVQRFLCVQIFNLFAHSPSEVLESSIHLEIVTIIKYSQRNLDNYNCIDNCILIRHGSVGA